MEFVCFLRVISGRRRQKPAFGVLSEDIQEYVRKKGSI
jgi:hypothetical protein